MFSAFVLALRFLVSPTPPQSSAISTSQEESKVQNPHTVEPISPNLRFENVTEGLKPTGELTVASVGEQGPLATPGAEVDPVVGQAVPSNHNIAGSSTFPEIDMARTISVANALLTAASPPLLVKVSAAPNAVFSAVQKEEVIELPATPVTSAEGFEMVTPFWT